jgi:hypothetical protein
MLKNKEIKDTLPYFIRIIKENNKDLYQIVFKNLPFMPKSELEAIVQFPTTSKGTAEHCCLLLNNAFARGLEVHQFLTESDNLNLEN